MRVRPIATFAVVATAASLSAVALAAPASAAPTIHAFPLPAAAGGRAAPAPSPLAGYLAPVTTANQAVSVNLRVPVLTCSAGVSPIVATVGVGSTTANKFIGVVVEMGCNNTTAYYRAAVINQSRALSDVVTVAAGAVLVVNAKAGPTSAVASIKVPGTTTPVSGTTGAFTADLSQFTVQAGTSPYAVFRSLAFAKAKVSGVLLGSASPERRNQVSAARKVELRTSAVSATGNFTVIYVSQG